MSGWTASDMPRLDGRTAIVTGANSGLGLMTALELARHGAAVTLAVRDAAKGDAAADTIRAQAPDASVEVKRLDLADLSSVRGFADLWSRDHDGGLDLLVNNAGIMAIPRQDTVDGYEAQFATNHLGHFALTGLLLPALIARPRSRVVTVSSNVHRMGRVNFDDLMGRRRYFAWSAYAQSKLANLLFTIELQRLLDVNGLSTLSLAAHPGYASTNLQAAGPRLRGSRWQQALVQPMNAVMGQSAAMGALPTLFAATAPGVPGAAYVGPGGFLEIRGTPKFVGRSGPATNPADARRLWHVSEDLTGVHYPFDVA